MNETLKIKALDFLIGKWKGKGFGNFPTIKAFQYQEELCFILDPYNDFIRYEQKTWQLDGITPMHWEYGFIKPIADRPNFFEISNCQDSGRLEVLEGTTVLENDNCNLHFKSKLIANDSKLIRTERFISVNKNQLKYQLKMATNTTPKHQTHLDAKLIKET